MTLRWIAFLPAAFAAYAAVSYLSNYIFGALWTKVDLTVISIGNLIFCQILAPLAYLLAGTFTAPDRRARVALGLATFYTILTIIVFALEVFRRAHAPGQIFTVSLPEYVSTAIVPLGIVVLACVYLTKRERTRS